MAGTRDLMNNMAETLQRIERKVDLVMAKYGLKLEEPKAEVQPESKPEAAGETTPTHTPSPVDKAATEPLNPPRRATPTKMLKRNK